MTSSSETAAGEETKTSHEERPKGERSGRRILVVDDDDVLLIVETLLSNAGYEVLVARTGREGLERALRDGPELILLDVMMPQLSGWEVCATLKSLPETASTPIAMFTVKSEIKDLITGMQVGADDYVTKPFTKKRLLEAVERLLSKHAAARPHFLPKEATDLRARNLLFDGVTGLPTVPVIVDAGRDKLLVDQEAGVLFVDIEKYSHIEDFYGWEVFDEVLREAARSLKRLLGTLFSTEDLIAINRPSGSEYYVFLSIPAALSGEETIDRLQKKARQLEETLRQQLSERFRQRIHQKIALYVGYGKIRYSPQVRLERLVYRALREAIAVVASKEGERAALLREQFRDIFTHRQVATLYQPIVDLDGRGLRLGGTLARPRRVELREPGGPLRLRAQDGPDLESREDLHGQLRAPIRRETPGRPLRERGDRAHPRAEVSGPRRAQPAAGAPEWRRPGDHRARRDPGLRPLPRERLAPSRPRLQDRDRRRRLGLRIAPVDRRAEAKLPQDRELDEHVHDVSLDRVRVEAGDEVVRGPAQ